MVSIFFAANPAVLDKLNYSLRIDERVLRYKVLKQRTVPKYPSPYYVGKALRMGYAHKLKAKFDPITNGFPHAAWKALISHMPQGRLEPGAFGQLARDASAAIKGQSIEQRAPIPGLAGGGILPSIARGPKGFVPRTMHTSAAGGGVVGGVHGSFAASALAGGWEVESRWGVDGDEQEGDEDVCRVPPQATSSPLPSSSS